MPEVPGQDNRPGTFGFSTTPAPSSIVSNAIHEMATITKREGAFVTWRGIEEFLAVIETGSFTAAAEALGVSKSYVSKMVSELEARIGAQLLVRTTRRLSLTAAGDIFHRCCLDMRTSLTSVERQISQFQQRPVGRLRIGLSSVFGTTYMAAIVADFSARHPEISLEVVAYLSEADLVQEQFDVVIRYGKLIDSSLKARLFGYLSYCLCASPDYVKRNGWPESPADLANHTCLSDLRGNFYFNGPDGGVERVKVSGYWKSNSGIVQMAAARRGLGIAQVPISVIGDDLAQGRLIALEQDWAFYDKEVWAVFSSGMMPAATRAFIDYLAGRFDHAKLRPWMQPAMERLASYLS